MRIYKSDVVRENEPKFVMWVPQYGTGAENQRRAADAIKLTPDDGSDAQDYTVRFNTKMLLMAADPQPFVFTLTNALKQFLGSVPQALTSGGFVANGATAMAPVIDAVDSALAVAAKAVHTKVAPTNIEWVVPVFTKPCTYDFDARVEGYVLVDNNSVEDLATTKFHIAWGGTESSFDNTTWLGEVSDAIHPKGSLANMQGGGEISTEALLFVKVQTDGGMINTEFSSVWVSEVVMHYKENCPAGTAELPVPKKHRPRQSEPAAGTRIQPGGVELAPGTPAPKNKAGRQPDKHGE